MSGQVFAERPARLRKYAGRFVTCLVALLALLALDDITTGVESGFLTEWAMVAVASAWFVSVGARSWTRRQI